jgi:hypothetical protein
MGSKTTAEIQNTPNQYNITSVSSYDVSDVLSKIEADRTLADFTRLVFGATVTVMSRITRPP